MGICVAGLAGSGAWRGGEPNRSMRGSREGPGAGSVFMGESRRCARDRPGDTTNGASTRIGVCWEASLPEGYEDGPAIEGEDERGAKLPEEDVAAGFARMVSALVRPALALALALDFLRGKSTWLK